MARADKRFNPAGNLGECRPSACRTGCQSRCTASAFGGLGPEAPQSDDGMDCGAARCSAPASYAFGSHDGAFAHDSDDVRGVVVDRTGLGGPLSDIDVEFSPEFRARAPPGPRDRSAAERCPSLFTAIQEHNPPKTRNRAVVEMLRDRRLSARTRLKLDVRSRPRLRQA